jgi:hypothetical protein
MVRDHPDTHLCIHLRGCSELAGDRRYYPGPRPGAAGERGPNERVWATSAVATLEKEGGWSGSPEKSRSTMVTRRWTRVMAGVFG